MGLCRDELWSGVNEVDHNVVDDDVQQEDGWDQDKYTEESYLGRLRIVVESDGVEDRSYGRTEHVIEVFLDGSRDETTNQSRSLWHRTREPLSV